MPSIRPWSRPRSTCPAIASCAASAWSAASSSAPAALSAPSAPGLQSLVGGDITLYTELCEQAREDAYQLMIDHAGEAGANAIIGVRYDANEIAAGITEVLAYGTAVVVEPAARG